ncbi:AMP-binding protein [Pseudomaricurvus alcaniphilus]|uniref:AMP-binding protein n=1 Tax=Pseudomaricurvus alcaniphilus TaxID=1166482 RepID=UPI0014087588|nr:AMP-binding protein [Pseudomaricurvus alcaniphilus]NHN35994.1 AMP-binding protein [Pseudomaricurvus alcaniphilus]
MDKQQLQTVPDVFRAAFRCYPGNAAFTCLGQTLSFAEVDRYSQQFASYLQHHTDLQPGDRVAVQLANILQYPVVMFGVLRAGMILVNTNPMYTGREVEHQLRDSGARVLVVMANLAKPAADIIANTSVEQVIVTEMGDLHGFPKRQLINFTLRHVKKMVPEFSFPRQVSFRDCLRLGNNNPCQDVQSKAEDVAVLQYTGGTTGVAKGAMLTHHNLVSNLRQVSDSIGDRIQEGVEIFVAPLPLYHIYAFMIHGMLLVASGNHSILIPNPRDLDSLVKAIKPFPFTGFAGLNTLFNGLCHNDSFKALDFSALKLTTSGGMALTSDVAELWQRTTGCAVVEGYGLTETSPVLAFNPLNGVRLGTVGVPVADTEVRLMDDAGNEVAAGGAGELWVRGPQVMKGYWQQPQATAEVLTADGWFKTGDIAELSADNYIKIVDRKKDMIIVSGFNVYPNEIENEVGKHPKVLEAAAIGVPSDKTGEAVKLFVVKDDPSLSKEELMAFCRENLTGYKIPHRIEFIDALPKSNVGKVLRKELR